MRDREHGNAHTNACRKAWGHARQCCTRQIKIHMWQVQAGTTAAWNATDHHRPAVPALDPGRENREGEIEGDPQSTERCSVHPTSQSIQLSSCSSCPVLSLGRKKKVWQAQKKMLQGKNKNARHERGDGAAGVHVQKLVHPVPRSRAGNVKQVCGEREGERGAGCVCGVCRDDERGGVGERGKGAGGCVREGVWGQGGKGTGLASFLGWWGWEGRGEREWGIWCCALQEVRGNRQSPCLQCSVSPHKV